MFERNIYNTQDWIVDSQQCATGIKHYIITFLRKRSDQASQTMNDSNQRKELKNTEFNYSYPLLAPPLWGHMSSFNFRPATDY
ncbi:YD repeat protein [Desulfovibrio ferrophilus]|uniref:YD repeat protein n=1 Tax=Desulfovibrio ferrophilus TaxID=241368 RepID=A0A2Z6AVV1_9BACT|nr:YD repeat protein [Desulfovibrio ferrophilus]